jgi:hypothetical protein
MNTMAAPAANSTDVLKSLKDAIVTLIAEVIGWCKRLAGLGLAVFVLLTILKLFGFPTYFPIPTLGWSDFGWFVAGTAFYLGARL